MSNHQHIPSARLNYWGKPDTATEIAEGIVWVSTPGHGGFALSHQRQAEMPAHLRVDQGAYEEDCDWCMVVLAFPHIVPAYLRAITSKWSVDRLNQCADETLRNWHPARWEQHTGKTIEPGQSFQRDQQRFREQHAADFIVCTAWGDWAEGVPAGMVGVWATEGEDRSKEGKYFLVPADEYAARGDKFVIDLAKHQEIPPINGGHKTKQLALV